MHDDYGYTHAWVDFLIEKLKDAVEFESLYNAAVPGAATSPPSVTPSATAA